jgi:hypothetical protein
VTVHIVHLLRRINAETFAALQHVTLSAVNARATEIRIHMTSDGGTNDQGFAAYSLGLRMKDRVSNPCVRARGAQLNR